jgi:hypothetical protein
MLLFVQQVRAELGEFVSFDDNANGTTYERIKKTLEQYKKKASLGGGTSGLSAADKPEWREADSEDDDEEDAPMTAPRTTVNGKGRAAVVLDDEDDDE